MSICSKCGTSCADNAKFCENCGSPMEQQFQHMESMQQSNQGDYNRYEQSRGDGTIHGNYNQAGNGNPYNSYSQPGYGGGYSPNIQPRNIAVAIILSLVTCGFYSIYWMIKMNDEINELAGEPDAISGGLVFLFSLITCGIYSFYWMFKMGERCDRIKGAQSGNSGILYLILSFFGFGIVSYCLMQDTINKAV